MQQQHTIGLNYALIITLIKDYATLEHLVQFPPVFKFQGHFFNSTFVITN